MPWRPLLTFVGISVGTTSAIAIVSASMGWTVYSPAWGVLAPVAMWAPALGRLVARRTVDRRFTSALPLRQWCQFSAIERQSFSPNRGPFWSAASTVLRFCFSLPRTSGRGASCSLWKTFCVFQGPCGRVLCVHRSGRMHRPGCPQLDRTIGRRNDDRRVAQPPASPRFVPVDDRRVHDSLLSDPPRRRPLARKLSPVITS
jgi:hypothetical protein